MHVSRGRWYIEFRNVIKNLKGNYAEGNYEKKAMHLALVSRETRIDIGCVSINIYDINGRKSHNFEIFAEG